MGAYELAKAGGGGGGVRPHRLGNIIVMHAIIDVLLDIYLTIFVCFLDFLALPFIL